MPRIFSRFPLAAVLPCLAVALFVACGNGDDSTDGTGGGGSSGGADGGSKSGADGGSTSGGEAGTGTGIATGDGSLFCNDTTDHYCVAFTSVPSGADEQDCDFLSGVQVDACPSTDVVATCTFNAGGTDQEYFWYQGTTGTTTELNDECDALSGTFTSF